MERRLGYRPGLDGIRAVAIGLVLLNHTGLRIFFGGGNGVIVFFVLSGFLITKLMIEEWERSGGISVTGFYGRRAVRILPAPTVMLAILLCGSWTIASTPEEHTEFLKQILLAATYLTNMKPLLDPVRDGLAFDGGLGHMWSLAVEEQFYLVWPIAMIALALPMRRATGVVKGILGVAAIVVVVRFGVYYLPFLDPDLGSISVFSFDGFALGAALAFALHHGVSPALERTLAKPVVPIVALAVLAIDLLAGSTTHRVSQLYVVYCSIAAAALLGHLFVAPGSRLSKWAALPPVVYIGKLSYSIYLWHNPIWVFVSTERFPDVPVVLLTLIEWTLTIVAVLGSYYLIERPASKLRRRFAHDHTPSPAAPAAVADVGVAPVRTG